MPPRKTTIPMIMRYPASNGCGGRGGGGIRNLTKHTQKQYSPITISSQPAISRIQNRIILSSLRSLRPPRLEQPRRARRTQRKLGEFVCALTIARTLLEGNRYPCPFWCFMQQTLI